MVMKTQWSYPISAMRRFTVLLVVFLVSHKINNQKHYSTTIVQFCLKETSSEIVLRTLKTSEPVAEHHCGVETQVVATGNHRICPISPRRGFSGLLVVFLVSYKINNQKDYFIIIEKLYVEDAATEISHHKNVLTTLRTPALPTRCRWVMEILSEIVLKTLKTSLRAWSSMTAPIGRLGAPNVSSRSRRTDPDQPRAPPPSRPQSLAERVPPPQPPDPSHPASTGRFACP